MKIALYLLASLALAFTVKGQALPQNFKPGAYRGTMIVTTSIEGVGETSATLKLKGRSTGDAQLKFMGAPQLDQPLLISSNYPIKRFNIYPESGFAGLIEFQGTANSTFLLDTLTVKGNVVKADLSYSYDGGTETVSINLKIQLTRVGN